MREIHSVRSRHEGLNINSRRRIIRHFGTMLSIWVFATCLSAQAQDPSNILKIEVGSSSQTILDRIDGSFAFMDRQFIAEEMMGVAGVSSDTAYLLVIAGEVRINELSAKSGDLLIVPTYQGQVSKHVFDARKLQSSLKANQPDLSEPLTGRLDALARKQGRQVYWGVYQPTRLNVAAPVSVEDELARRSILSNEDVRAIRFGSGANKIDLEQTVIQEFQKALREADIDTVANLLDPAAFGFADLRDGGAEARHLYARSIVQQRDWSSLLTKHAFQATTQPGLWRLNTEEENLTIRLRTRGDFVFVSLGHGED